MAEAALKIEPEFHRMSRVLMPDLVDNGAYLCKRIKEHWPQLQDRQILGWLQGCANSNEYLFIRTEKAWLLAQVQREFTEPYPWCKEIFCFAVTDDGNYDKGSEGEKYQKDLNADAIMQAASLYEDLIRWAQKICANEIIVDKYTDVPVKNDKDATDMATIKGRMGRLFKSEEIFARLDPDKIRKV